MENKFKFQLLILYLSIFILIFPNIANTMYSDHVNKNIFDNNLELCTNGTGFYRNGYCKTGDDDLGTHVVCAQVNQKFLSYTKSKGNDLSTPTSYFPGLKPGDYWCLCGYRFEQARKDGFAPKVKLEATNIKALQFTPLEELKNYSINNKEF